MSDKFRPVPLYENSYLAFFKTTDILHNSIVPPVGADLIESDTPLQQRVTASLSREGDVDHEGTTFRRAMCSKAMEWQFVRLT